jgi:hypothetical protein
MAGSPLYDAGDEGDEVYFVASGAIRVRLPPRALLLPPSSPTAKPPPSPPSPPSPQYLGSAPGSPGSPRWRCSGGSGGVDQDAVEAFASAPPEVAALARAKEATLGEVRR